jgi:MoxR-like ATPase
MKDGKKDWKIFRGDGLQHDEITDLPEAPPWRFARPQGKIVPRPEADSAEETKAAPFLPSKEMIRAVNAALYLRRPLLLTGKPGTGKSSLIGKVAHELKLGAVVHWPISSRSTVRSGIYEYDAVGRLHAGKDVEVSEYLTLGPLGTALMARGRPRALLVDEIDKSDLDFANDLLNVIDEGRYEIPELRRLKAKKVIVKDWLGAEVEIDTGLIEAEHFPFVVMTSNGEREFPAPFLRRCIRLNVEQPDKTKLNDIVKSQLSRFHDAMDQGEVEKVLEEFLKARAEADVSTDQLLNAVFLTVAMRNGEGRSFDGNEAEMLRLTLLRQLSGGGA